MSEKGVTVNETITTGFERRPRFYSDEEIRELFDDDPSTLVIALLNRSQAAEAAIEQRDAVIRQLIELIDAADYYNDAVLGPARKLLEGDL